ncbi:hypothetical protein [Pseudotabrizicola sp.]|uniref:hypothetical protein n=1 Tax=Pseudotabrizicola sp. TaxID=2939647 RepID=UPI0027295D29|nr:hypothetical protein [Pseudotabrizicola sp.]
MIDDLLPQLSNWWGDLERWWRNSLTTVTRDDYTPFLDVSGFLGILAFSVAVFTLTSAKFQIRQATALVPLRPVFFVALITSGMITFLIEAFILYELKIPSFLNPNKINYFVSAVLSILILYWMCICFVRPPRFSRFTARRFFQQTYIHINNGGKDEMLALARELMREAPRLMRHAPQTKQHYFKNEEPITLSAVQTHAHFLLELLGDTRFCEMLASEIPSFPAHMVEEAINMKRYDVRIQLMVRRTVLAMLKRPNSALFVENEWLEQGFIGDAKPITRAIFKNWHYLESYERGLESPLDMSYPHARTWDTETWRVYFGLAREYVRGLVFQGRPNWDARGIHYILETTKKAYENLGDMARYESTFSSQNPLWHAREANKFLNELVVIFDESGGWVGFDRTDDFRYGHDLSSRIAELRFETIFTAAQVNTKEFRMWDVQHNLVWYPIEMRSARETKVMMMASRKLRRMIWNEIVQMDDIPNYKGAAYIRFCLNVLGFYDPSIQRKRSLDKDSWPLAKVLADWVRRNYQTVAKSHPPVAKAMLPANIEYDPVSQTLVRLQDDTLTGVPRRKVFALNVARPDLPE